MSWEGCGQAGRSLVRGNSGNCRGPTRENGGRDGDAARDRSVRRIRQWPLLVPWISRRKRRIPW